MMKTGKKKAIHVTYDRRRGEWVSKRQGASQILYTAPHKREIEVLSRTQARQDRTALVIHKKDGTVQRRDNYSDDPLLISPPLILELPLQMDVNGVIRVSGTRVTLYTLLTFYRQGESAERLHEGFPTVPLKDIYAVIAYYLANQETVDEYLNQIDEEADRIRAQHESENPPLTRAELKSRLESNS